MNSFSLLSLIVSLLAPIPLPPDRIEPVGVELRSEKVSPADIDVGFVESMEDAIARDQARPQEPDYGPNYRGEEQGTWNIPSVRATYFPRSGVHNLVNKWGDTRMGIGFRGTVNLGGVYVSGQAGAGVWSTGVRAVGYLGDTAVATTDWFRDVDNTPSWFNICFQGVDRVVIEAEPVINGAGWYALDDLTFARRGPDGRPQPDTVLDFEDTSFGQKLTGSNYAGLTWEVGTGHFRAAAPGIAGPPKLVDLTAGLGPLVPGPRGGGGTLPILSTNFQGVIRGQANSFSYPPDTCGAVGPTQFVVTVNRNFAIFDKSFGTSIVNMSLGSFLPGSNGDPRVIYDQYSGRWFIIVSDFSTRIYLAVSTTSDANGSWFKTSFVASTDGDTGCFPDYPTLGVDADGIYMGSYMVGCGMTIFAIPKAPLIAGSPTLGTVWAFRGLPYEQAIQPVHTFGTPAVAGQYFTSEQSSTQIRVRRLTNITSTPSLTTVAAVPVPSHGFPPDVPSLGGATPLDSIDNRHMNAVYRNGSIWTAHNVEVSGRAAVRWYEISENTMTTLQVGQVDSPTLNYWMPSIMVNSVGDMVLGFSGADATQYASAYYTGRRATDPTGQTAPPALLQAGVAPQNNIDQYGRNRWGDYSLCSLDPSDDTKLWTIQEYAAATDTWGTWVGRVSFAPPDISGPAPDPMTFAIAPMALGTTSVTMSATPATDATPPVQYLFQCTSATPGGTSSFWQVGETHIDSGLSANTAYSYRLAARDSNTPTPNQSAFSPDHHVATSIETPQGLATGVVGVDFIELVALGTFSNLSEGQSGLYFDSLTPGGDTGLNVWVQGTMATASGLMPDTDYEFVLKARNRDGVETALCDPISVHTYWVSGDCNNDLIFSVESDLDCIVEALLGNETSPPGGAHRIDLNYNEITDGEDIQFILDCLQFGGC
ncbi:MAG TPA: hypothetical protein VJZ71_18835 [Phycisphaerae bacterium]|nr:hypothetical protein [Phycisphaerae bacterium]